MKKKWLWALVPALVIPVLVFSGCSPGGATWAGPSDVPSPLTLNLDSQQTGIWVSGQGKVSATPDIAVLRLGIEVQEQSVAQAQAEAAQAMDNVVQTLKDNGVAEKDIQTQYFNIHKVTRWNGETEQEVVLGYRVTNVVVAKIRDVGQAGSIIDAVAAAAGDLTRIDSISFSIDDPSPYYTEARDKAMADAKAKAEQLASLAGARMGEPTYISEGSIYVPPVYPRAVFDESFGGAPAPPTSISPGELEISLLVQVSYAILD